MQRAKLGKQASLLLLQSLVGTRVTQLSLLEDVVPDDVGDVVAHRFNRLFDVAAVFFYLGSNELHDGITALLACLEEQAWCHFVN